MRPKLLVVFLIIVLLPLGLLVGLGVRVARDEQLRVRREMGELLVGRLRDIDAAVGRLLREREHSLVRHGDSVAVDAESLRDLTRHTPFARQFFAVAADGALIYPDPRGPLTDAEREFLSRTRRVWLEGYIGGGHAGPQTLNEGKAVPPQPAQVEGRPAAGWLTWYWEDGLHLLYWWRSGAGRILGAEVDRTRLLADIIAILPDGRPGEADATPRRLRLVDDAGAVLYQWGEWDPPDGEAPRATLLLSPPLHAWKLEYFTPPNFADRELGGLHYALIAAAAVAVLASLFLLAAYFYRESTRELREAAQRVNFVNQVSHELKTPLTNIRMYAELLEERLGDDDAAARRDIGVIAGESRRLSRLINNVLTFARGRRRRLVLRPRPGVVDDVVAAVLEHFRLALSARGVEIAFTAGAAARVSLDSDALEQVLANLFSNVEKYAAGGGRLEVTTARDGDTTAITVADRGPGVPAAQREKIFRPFHRLDDRLTEGAAGAGIGLSIARDLARLHGGDVRLEPSPAGARFVVILHTPPLEGDSP